MEHQSVSSKLTSRWPAVTALFAALAVSGCMTMKPEVPASAPPSDPSTVPTGPVVQAGAIEPAKNADNVRFKPPEVAPPKPVPQVANTAPAKPGEAYRLTAAFSNKVMYAPDPTRGGDPVPGLLGRLYVFSTDEGVPIIADGELVVDVWDNSPKTNGGSPKLLEVWQIDPVAFAKFRKRDIVGEGYSIFLPWSTYHVDVRQINVIVRHTGKDGRVLVSSPESLIVDHASTLQRAADKIGGITGEKVAR